MSVKLSREDLEWVAVGSVRHGEYMRRYIAEAEEVAYRECTEDDLEIIDDLES